MAQARKNVAADRKPLSGVRVLEIARILAGPWAGQLLADLGADVVKVERPETGDDTRAFGPPFIPGKGEGHLSAAYFHSCNRGKRSITIDFQSQADCKRLRKLAARADVLIENYRVGKLKEFGLDYQSLKRSNPGLIYCSITAFGQDGPYAHRAGYDFIVQGMSGIMDITGEPDGEPQKVGVAYADVFTGLYSTCAILAALRERERTKKGAFIDMALLDVQTSVLANQALNYLATGVAPRRLGNAHPNIVPYQVFPVADGHIIVAVGNDQQFEKFVQVLGKPELARDSRFVTNQARVKNRSVLVPILRALTAEKSGRWLLAALEKKAVPAGPINSVGAVFADPQIVARGMRIDLESAAAKGGRIPAVRTPIVMNGEPIFSRRSSPALGEHTAEVFNDAAWKGASKKSKPVRSKLQARKGKSR